MKPQIKADREEGVFVVILTYENGTYGYITKLAPSPRVNGFVLKELKDQNGKSVSGSHRYKVEVDATRELFAWLEERLKAPPTHVSVSTLGERVEVAFLVTLGGMADSQLDAIRPIGNGDLVALFNIAQAISEQIGKRHAEARHTAQQLSPGYLQELKRAAIRDWRESHPLSDAKRDFYSSVLSTAFAWKGGRIPRVQYEYAQRVREGVFLALKLQ